MVAPGAWTPLAWTPELVARFWDYESTRAGHYFTQAYGAAIVATFARHARAGATVVDFGCGAGHLLPHLFPFAGRVFGMDHSPRSRAEVAARFGKEPKFAGVLAPEEIGRLAGQADLLFCIEVVEHLDDAVLAQLLATIRSLLKPDGVAILTTPNREELAANELFCPQCQHTFHRWQHVRSWEPATLAAAVRAHGLDVVAMVETDFRAHRAVSPRRFWKRKLRQWRGRRVRSPHLACALRPLPAPARS